MRRIPFSAIGFYEPACIACDALELSDGAEKLRKFLARGLVGSCAGDVKHSFHYNQLTVYLCERHAEQKKARAK